MGKGAENIRTPADAGGSRQRPSSHPGARWVITRVAIAPKLHTMAVMFSAAKDMMTSRAAKAYINDFIRNYGSVEELTIDSKRQRIDVTCTLHGEVSAISVTIEKYHVERREGKTFFRVVDTSATRVWMQAAMRDHLHGRSFELPSWAAAAL